MTDAIQGDTIDLSLRMHHYIQAKDAYLQARKQLLEMKVLQQEARVAVRMPRTPLIIRQRPE